jgi:hypothetical protein
VESAGGRASSAWSGASPLLLGFLFGSLALTLFAFSLSAFCLSSPSACDFSAIFLLQEDRWLLLVQTFLLLLACGRLDGGEYRLSLPRSAMPLIALVLIVLCYVGTKWLLLDYPYSRDEQMAVFDSQIFRSGLLVQPLPSLWQTHTAALNSLFMLPADHPVAWVSAYLPMNALLRTVVGFIADPALTGPLMVALGLVSLWKCARLLWPDEREAAIIAVLLYLGSGQIVFAGMTAFAMPAHLAFNLLWLWFFLLNRRTYDCAALLVAFAATGLHQPLFHPLFAAPILLFTIVRERDWPRVALYGIGYAAICAFWFAWPNWMHALIAGSNATAHASGADYVTRLIRALSQSQPMRWEDTGTNLLRFFGWQHVLLLPLIACGFVTARRDRLAAAFATAVILPVCVMALILPFQGNGFGYRYLHGALGAVIVLAVYGWRLAVSDHALLRPLIVRTTVAGIMVLLPLQAWMAHRMYAPFAHIDRRIDETGADYFMVGRDDALLAFNLVVNRPDLSNRPVRLLADEVNDSLIRSICVPGARVAMPTSAFLHPIEDYFATPHSTAADVRITALSPRLVAAGCKVDPLGGE